MVAKIVGFVNKTHAKVAYIRDIRGNAAKLEGNTSTLIGNTATITLSVLQRSKKITTE